ncbi:hypothetical protein DIPPA_08797 [Diplonema papillatum]|nr:hypothetical protein DIPPA_08797 [Diplonema papillatum]|eukprot:gene10652-16391_t
MEEEEATRLLCFRFLPGRYPFGTGDLADNVFSARQPTCSTDETRPWHKPLHLRIYCSVIDVFLDLFAAFAVMGKYVITLETLFAANNSIWAVIIYDWTGRHFTSDMTWTLVSFALVFPLTMSITRAFVRREAALRSLADLRSLLCNILMAHSRWNWVGGQKQYNGRTVPPVKPATDDADNSIKQTHMAEVLALQERIVDAMRSYLLVPRRGKARHIYTVSGYQESRWVTWAEEEGGHRVTKLIMRLHGATETLKSAGLPPNEASRINQYVYFVTRTWEQLRAVKEYRTPMAMRAFSRIVVHTLPVLYAPYFLYIGMGAGHDKRNIAFACAFSSVMSVFMCGLMLVQNSLEDPFETRSIDSVKVDVEMGRTLRVLRSAARDVQKDWRGDTPSLGTDGPDTLLKTLRYDLSGVAPETKDSSLAAYSQLVEFNDTTPNQRLDCTTPLTVIAADTVIDIPEAI